VSKKTYLGMTIVGLAVLIGFFVGRAGAQSKQESLPVLKTSPKILIVFKNGLGFFMREGTTSLRDGWAVTEGVPSAALGSFWVTALDAGSVVEESVSFLEETEKETPAQTLEALLGANVGKKVVLTANNERFEGVIKAAPGQIVLLAVGDGEEIALNKAAVVKVEFLGPHAANTSGKVQVKRMKFKIADGSKQARLMLSYLQKGVTWLPSYLVNIEDPKRARLSMKATLVNDVEDLEGVDAYFVVGYPNFRFANVLSPMALDRAMADFLAALEQEESKGEAEFGRLANVMSQRVAPLEETVSLDAGLAGPPGVLGAPEEDLFLYAKKGLSLKKGERAEYPIFSKEVDYKHVYEWKIPDTLYVDYSGYQQSGQRQEQEEQVWHAVKLFNATDFPWTTAPAFTVSGWKPLAQEILNYTPRGTSTNLKLTVATDIKVGKREEETARQRDVRIRNSSYDLVTVKGELDVKNAKTKDVVVEIKKRLTGEVLETSHGGHVIKAAEGLRGVNSNALISWEIPVKAGEEIKVGYTYKVYIHN